MNKLITKASIFAGICILLQGCAQHQPVNYYKDVTQGDTAKLRVIGFTAESTLWTGFTCDKVDAPGKNAPKVRQTDEVKPAFIDKGFVKSVLPQGIYPLDIAEFYISANKITIFIGRYTLSSGESCLVLGPTFKAEKDKLYEIRNRIEGNKCILEFYQVEESSSPVKANRLPITQFKDICTIPK
ncbi:hypothetical protein [Yersinia pseudotuberculosis]|uniref:hypothetical protein n=1 Tax=Yersinia pseudotuberculosis TaxID=633 RepID=UPI0003D5D206|nr:hypothetical protein [Yersinia pseudotuberculosis]GAE11582.1 hypothetical protein YP1_044_00130 [Yersinia pseudotuberculosis NBRC 105692]VEG88471.1 Uncharacterised protein [Yersinia pseudotuberculosis]